MTSDEIERLMIVAVREYGQAKVALEQASLVLDAVVRALDDDAQERIVAAVKQDPDGAGEDGSTKGRVCPVDGCKLELLDVTTMGTHERLWFCPDHGEVVVDAE